MCEYIKNILRCVMCNEYNYTHNYICIIVRGAYFGVFAQNCMSVSHALFTYKRLVYIKLYIGFCRYA